MSPKFPLITILGPTAVGKTTFAAHLALSLDAEIISADSRQVFREMNIGTGKDLGDYSISGEIIPCHLIDIAEPGTEYNVFQFQRDFQAARNSILLKGKIPLMCGGTGLYLESALLGYNLVEAPVDEILRLKLSSLPNEELIKRIASYRPLHNTTDTLDRDRLIRAIEIEYFKNVNQDKVVSTDFSHTPVFGIRFNRKIIRERITARLTQRLKEGMLEEVRQLLDKGLTKEQLMFYGLEYKYLTLYLSGDLAYNEMFRLLNTAIHQFAKRQMTWYRRMENKGIKITWLEGEDGLTVNLDKAMNYLKSN